MPVLVYPQFFGVTTAQAARLTEWIFRQERAGTQIGVPRAQVQQSAGIGVLAGEAQAGYRYAGLLNRHAVGIVIAAVGDATANAGHHPHRAERIVSVADWLFNTNL
jgi:hypothetical protein